VKFNRNRTSASILGRFSLLASEYGLRRRSVGGADEWVDRYEGENLAVTITLSYPELPLVVLIFRETPPIAFAFSLERSREARPLKRRYYATLEGNDRLYTELITLQERVTDIQVRALRSALDTYSANPVASRRRRPGVEWVKASSYHASLSGPQRGPGA
jgi:hypothetical protein